jgi:hypothetical protein
MPNALSTLLKLVPWGIAACFICLSVYFRFEAEQVQGKLDAAITNQATLQAGLNVAETFNKSLNASITELQKVVVDERMAFIDVKKYADDVDHRMNSAVNDVKDLLNEEIKVDDCGDRRLPQSVIDRMWEYYRSSSGDKKGN